MTHDGIFHDFRTKNSSIDDWQNPEIWCSKTVKCSVSQPASDFGKHSGLVWCPKSKYKWEPITKYGPKKIPNNFDLIITYIRYRHNQWYFFFPEIRKMSFYFLDFYFTVKIIFKFLSWLRLIWLVTKCCRIEKNTVMTGKKILFLEPKEIDDLTVT